MPSNGSVAGEVRNADVPERVVKGMRRHPIPLLVLARLAVHIEWQGRGVGARLFPDSMGRVLQVAGIVRIRALAVHTKDGSAADFYRHFGFVSSPTDDRHLCMLIKNILAAAGD